MGLTRVSAGGPCRHAARPSSLAACTAREKALGMGFSRTSPCGRVAASLWGLELSILDRLLPCLRTMPGCMRQSILLFLGVGPGTGLQVAPLFVCNCLLMLAALGQQASRAASRPAGLQEQHCSSALCSSCRSCLTWLPCCRYWCAPMSSWQSQPVDVRISSEGWKSPPGRRPAARNSESDSREV